MLADANFNSSVLKSGGIYMECIDRESRSKRLFSIQVLLEKSFLFFAICSVIILYLIRHVPAKSSQKEMQVEANYYNFLEQNRLATRIFTNKEALNPFLRI